MATNPITLLNGTTAYASDVETKVNPLYTALDPTNFSASALAGSGNKVVTDTGAAIGTPTITNPTIITGTYTGNQTFDTTTMFVDATNNVVQFGTVGAVPATFAGVAQYSSTSGGNVALFTSTDAGADGASFYLYANSASPAANDKAGQFRFFGNDSGGAAQEYGRVQVIISDPTAASEDSSMSFHTCDAGTLAEKMRIDGDGNLLIGISAASTIGTAPITTSTTGNLGAIIESTAEGSTGAVFQLFHKSASAASGDYIGAVRFAGLDSGGVATNFARIIAVADDITNISEDGVLRLEVLVAGTNTTGLEVNGSSKAISLPSSWQLDIPATDPPTANLANRNSFVKAWAAAGVGTASTGSVTGYNITSISVSSWVSTITWDTDFASTSYIATSGIGETGSATDGEYYIVNTDVLAGSAEFTAYSNFGGISINDIHSYSVIAMGDQ